MQELIIAILFIVFFCRCIVFFASYLLFDDIFQEALCALDF